MTSLTTNFYLGLHRLLPVRRSGTAYGENRRTFALSSGSINVVLRAPNGSQKCSGPQRVQRSQRPRSDKC